METASAVQDGKLDDDEMGVLFRRLMEIAKRIDNGALNKKEVMSALQAIIEGRLKDMLTPCSRPHLSPRRTFTRLTNKERATSLTPIRLRLPHSGSRLGLFANFREKEPERTFLEQHPEDIMAEMWEAENVPRLWLNHGNVPLHSILGKVELTDQTVSIVASTFQWLGTSSGIEFLSRYVAVAKLSL